MVYEFKLPDLGEGVAEGEIVKWLVKEGDSIQEDQPMVEVMTDKATVQIPSPTAGTVKQLQAKEGETVKVGQNLVVLDNTKGGGGASAQQTQQQQQGSAPTPQPQNKQDHQQQQQQPPQQQQAQRAAPQQKEGEQGKPQQQQQQQQRQPQSQKIPVQSQEPSGGEQQHQQGLQRVVAAPATRKLARDLGIDIESVQGGGPGGRITEEDVRKAAGRQKAAPQQQKQQMVESRPPRQAETEREEEHRRTLPAHQGKPEERIPIRGIRKRIAEKMIQSAQGTASVTHVDEVDFSELVALREKTKQMAESKGIKLTYLPFIIKAVVATLKEFPHFNASIDDQTQEIVVKHYYNIGFAADTPNGLIVPVLKDADKKGLLEIAKELEQLSENVRAGKIQLEDIQGGTFTITNIGTLGGEISTPIINVPEVAILGVHRIQKKPVVREDKIVVRDMAFIALTFDHRIVDGADAARFTTRLISYLEAPGLLFLEALGWLSATQERSRIEEKGEESNNSESGDDEGNR